MLSSQPLSTLYCVHLVEKGSKDLFVTWSLQLHGLILCTSALNAPECLWTSSGQHMVGRVGDKFGLFLTSQTKQPGQTSLLPPFSLPPSLCLAPCGPLQTCVSCVRPGCLTKILLSAIAFQRSASLGQGWVSLQHSFLFAFMLFPLAPCQTLRKALDSTELGSLGPKEIQVARFCVCRPQIAAVCCSEVSDSIGW